MNKKERLKKSKSEHEEYLRKMGVHPKQISKAMPRNKQGKRLGVYEIPDYSVDTSMLSNNVDGNGFKSPTNQYTGTLVKGIATMHKSNAVPVLNDDEAKDVARMRRG